ncbi:hypothetical protein FrEUN1fDRAFT_4360 [Parafrankia sp. EUN1f]|nr:hypothetical protein FrEUN1fDRAFT_4360 [Parafrankia sp. EUN1f]
MRVGDVFPTLRTSLLPVMVIAMSEAFSSWSPFGVVSHVVLAGPALALFFLGLKLMVLRLRVALWFRLRWGPPPSQIAPPEPSMNTDGGEGPDAREREERLEAELARQRAEWRARFWGPAVAATILDLAHRGYLHISRDARHGLLVQRTAKPVEEPLVRHETTVLDLISAETATGPLPADVLLTEAQPDGEKWHDWVTADALRRPRQYQRLVTKLWVASALFGLTYAMINGLIEADFWDAPEVRTEETVNSPYQAWFIGFFSGALLTAVVTGVFYAWTSGWRRSLHHAQLKRTTRAIDAEPALATATADEIERFGIALVYAAALGRAPAAVAPFTRAAASSTGSWTSRGGTPRFVTIDQPATSTSPDVDIAGSETVVGHVLRSWTDSSGMWVALDDGRGDRTPARPIGDLVGPLPRRHARVRLTRHGGQTTWAVSTLEHAPGPPVAWVALRDVLSIAELERLLPGGKAKSNGWGRWVVRHPQSPTVLIRVSLWASRRPPGRLLLALGGRRQKEPARHQPTPGTADVAGRHHAVVRVGDVTALVLAIDRHRTDRQDTIAALVWLIAARLGAPVGDPPPALTGPAGAEEDRPSAASPS